jgi:hypothetical protein
LRWLGDRFLLVFGHRFDGAYSVSLAAYNRQGNQQQKYTDRVGVFVLDCNLAIPPAGFQELTNPAAELPFHRRDLNVVDMVRNDMGLAGVTAFGGVFHGDVVGYLPPVDFDLAQATPPQFTVTVRDQFKQALSHYSCPAVAIYQEGGPENQSAGTMYVTLFGGISQFHYDPATGQLIRDPVDLARFKDGMPFTNSQVTIVRQRDGSFQQFLWPQPLPEYSGAEARFQPVATAPTFPNGVIKLAEIKNRTLVGYIHGGIVSTAPYATDGKTSSSPKLYAVWIAPGPAAVIPMPPIPN